MMNALAVATAMCKEMAFASLGRAAGGQSACVKAVL